MYPVVTVVTTMISADRRASDHVHHHLVRLLRPAEVPARPAQGIELRPRSTSRITPTAPSSSPRRTTGNLTVPTLLFADGSALTNPSVAARSSRKLAELKLSSPLGCRLITPARSL